MVKNTLVKVLGHMDITSVLNLFVDINALMIFQAKYK